MLLKEFLSLAYGDKVYIFYFLSYIYMLRGHDLIINHITLLKNDQFLHFSATTKNLPLFILNFML
jgi:hypothetical protein